MIGRVRPKCTKYRYTVKSVEFAHGCDRFSALVFSATVRVLKSSITFFGRIVLSDFLPENDSFDIGNLPVLEKLGAEKRSHICANSTLFMVFAR